MDVSALDILAYNNTAIDISAVEIVVGGHFGHYPNFCNLFVRLTRIAAPLWKHYRFWPRGYKTSYSTQLSMKFFLLITIYEQEIFHAQLS